MSRAPATEWRYLEAGERPTDSLLPLNSAVQPTSLWVAGVGARAASSSPRKRSLVRRVPFALAVPTVPLAARVALSARPVSFAPLQMTPPQVAPPASTEPSARSTPLCPRSCSASTSGASPRSQREHNSAPTTATASAPALVVGLLATAPQAIEVHSVQVATTMGSTSTPMTVRAAAVQRHVVHALQIHTTSGIMRCIASTLTPSPSPLLPGECVSCPNSTARIFSATAIVLSALIVAAGLSSALNRSKTSAASRAARSFYDVLKSSGASTKLKVAISFYQCVTAISTVYVIRLPDALTDWLHTFDWMRVDWMSVLLPARCVGGVRQWMLMTATGPIIIVGLIMAGTLVQNRLKGKEYMEGAFRALGPCLFVVFLFAPNTNRAVFQTWDCVPFQFREAEEHYYMRNALDIRCPSGEHDSIAAAITIDAMAITIQ